MENSIMKNKLEQQLETMKARLGSIKKDVTHGYSGDSAEQAQERENDEVVDAIGNETAQSIRAIQAALERIEVARRSWNGSDRFRMTLLAKLAPVPKGCCLST